MDIRLLSPEIALSVAAALVLLLDLVLERKGALPAVSLLGILAAAFFSLTLAGNGGTSFAGTLVVDDFSVIFKLLFLGITALVVLSSVEYASRFHAYQGEYYGILLLSCVGMMLMASTGELISIYVALELTGIALFILSGFLKDEKSSEAGIKFLLLGAASSAVLLYGMALLFALSGTTNLSQMAQNLPFDSGAHRMALLLSMVLVVAGFGFKMATVPFHMWVPDVYEGAPTPITAFLSVASKSAGFAVVLRLFHTALGDTQLSADWSNLFAVLSALSMTLGNVVAVQQSNIKRMMGYSSIAHAGFIMVGLAVVPQLGPSGVIFYLLAYAFTNLGAFIAIIAISNKINSDLIADYAGVARRAPGLALALTLCLMSLTGIPPTAGFVAKFYIFNAAIQQGLLWLVLVGVINSVVSAYFYMGVVKAMYLGAPSTEESISTPAPIAIALATATIGVLLVGILPGAVIQAAAAAIGTLIP